MSREVSFRPSPLASAGARGDDEQARAAGYAAGWAAGARAAADAARVEQRRRTEEAERVAAERAAASARAVATLEKAAAAAATRSAPVLAQTQRALRLAAVELAEVVLQHELRPGPDSARALLERALALPALPTRCVIRVSPADLRHVQEVLDADGTRLPDGVELVAEPALRPGDVVREDPSAFIDATIRAALDRARQALLEDES